MLHQEANGVADALAKNHRVVAIDCRNHGKSDKPLPGGSGRAQDVVELMDHLKIDDLAMRKLPQTAAEDLLEMVHAGVIDCTVG